MTQTPVFIPGLSYAAPPRAYSVASPLAWPPRLIVIHDTGNTASASAEANYAATRTDSESNWTSAHAYIDTHGSLGSMPLSRQAWAAFGYANTYGIHLEMCGTNAGTPGAVPPVTIAATARLTAQLCDMAGIPKVKLTPDQVAAGRRGICGHLDITNGLHVGDHTDPGPSFDWAAFVAAVNAGEDDNDMTPEQDQRLKDVYAWARAACTGRDASGSVFNDPWDGAPVNGVRMLKDILAAVQHLPVSPPAALTDADRADIAARVAADLGSKLDELLAKLAAAGHALEG
jgi:N-acetyl-anhydromuramyl-L-alanine amidase AmpD